MCSSHRPKLLGPSRPAEGLPPASDHGTNPLGWSEHATRMLGVNQFPNDVPCGRAIHGFWDFFAPPGLGTLLVTYGLGAVRHVMTSPLASHRSAESFTRTRSMVPAGTGVVAPGLGRRRIGPRVRAKPPKCSDSEVGQNPIPSAILWVPQVFRVLFTVLQPLVSLYQPCP